MRELKAPEMLKNLPDPKGLITSIADGVIEGVEVLPRLATNVANVAQGYAVSVRSNMETLKEVPENPAVIGEVAIKAVTGTVKSGMDLVTGVMRAVTDTFTGVQGQVRKGTGLNL